MIEEREPKWFRWIVRICTVLTLICILFYAYVIHELNHSIDLCEEKIDQVSESITECHDEISDRLDDLRKQIDETKDELDQTIECLETLASAIE